MVGNSQSWKQKRIKAQFWSFDIIFAIVIFTVAMTILAYTWYNIDNQLSLSYGSGAETMQFETQVLAERLMTPGAPANWESLINAANSSTWNYISIGLTTAPNSSTISEQKVYTLMAMANYNNSNYQATKPAMGIGYDYYITITGKNINIEIGENPAEHNALTSYVYKTRAVFGNEPVLVKVAVWTNEPIAIS
ncbi:MAG: hypothetical protein M1544_00260 [Candidatus Marsarchaeota archaeon]|nr:hypothetical protein [Candidatus Marsarchaeota archaeon]